MAEWYPIPVMSAVCP